MIMYKDCRILFLALFEIFLCFYHTGLPAQKPSGNDSHTLIIYAIPSVVEIDWTSPGSLSYSAEGSFLLSEKCDYALGHMFVQLISPLLKEPLYAGMAVKSRKGLEKLVLIDKIGLGVLMVENEGYLEKNNKLIKIIARHSKNKKISAIRISINETAMKRVLQFIEKFDKTDEFGYKPSNYYGGVFWPLYENEGAGCAAFAMSILHLAGFSMEELEKWKVEVKLPMTLIGGKLNNGKKVKFRDVIETDQWYVGQGLPGKDYVSFSTYDPSLCING